MRPETLVGMGYGEFKFRRSGEFDYWTFDGEAGRAKFVKKYGYEEMDVVAPEPQQPDQPSNPYFWGLPADGIPLNPDAD